MILMTEFPVQFLNSKIMIQQQFNEEYFRINSI